MQKRMTTLVLATIATLAGCSSDSDSDSDNGNGTPVAATLTDVVSRPADSRPVDDGLDQVNADLLTLFGEADGNPIPLADDETVASFIAKQGASR